MAAPQFIDNDPAQIAAEMVAQYEELTGKPLPEAATERLIFNMCAVRESNVRTQIQSACMNMLIDFAVAPFLDYLVALVGVVRTPAQSAQCTLLLTLTADHTDTIIPSGMRVQTTDGKFVFALDMDAFVAEGTETVSVKAVCETPGLAANGYAIGKVSAILDPQPFLVSASNSDVTVLGTDTETDDQLRARAKLAPASFSVAGPEDAYKYFTFQVSPAIIDVAVTTPTGGTVHVFPLVAGGDPTPSELLTDVEAALSPIKRRPLTDTVEALSPTAVSYQLKINVTKISGAVNGDIIAEIESRVGAFTQAAGMKLGKDVTITKIKSLCMYDDTQVYDVELLDESDDPFTDKVVDETEYAYCTNLTVNVSGENAG